MNKKYRCPKCEYCTGNKQSYERHVRRVRACNKHRQCMWGCGYTSNRPSNLRRHEDACRVTSCSTRPTDEYLYLLAQWYPLDKIKVRSTNRTYAIHKDGIYTFYPFKRVGYVEYWSDPTVPERFKDKDMGDVVVDSHGVILRRYVFEDGTSYTAKSVTADGRYLHWNNSLLFFCGGDIEGLSKTEQKDLKYVALGGRA